MSDNLQTPYGLAADPADAMVRYAMHNELVPLQLAQEVRDALEDREGLRSALEETTAFLEEQHEAELSNEHAGDETCSYCDRIEANHALLDGAE